MPRLKPSKPYPEYPLFAHASGQWAKTILGKHHYFGVWEDPQGALESYLEKRDYLYAGQAPPITATTVGDILKAFKASKQAQLDLGRIRQRTYDDYEEICGIIGNTLNKHRPVNGITSEELRGLSTAIGKGK